MFSFHLCSHCKFPKTNDAPSGLENCGLDTKFAFNTKQENQQKELK